MSSGKNTFLFAAALLLCAVASAKDIEFEPCGGTVKAVDVSPCETDPCEIPRGSSVNITAVCVSDYDAKALKLSVSATIEGMEVPYPGMKRDACKGKNITCPIHKGEEITYVAIVPAKKFFPKIQTVTKFTLVTNDDYEEGTVCCFTAPVKVV